MKPYNNLDYQRYFTQYRFKRLNYKDLFVFNRASTIDTYFKGLAFYVYAGRFWFKVRARQLRLGFKFSSFIFPKQIAIYKKKQYLKKSKRR